MPLERCQMCDRETEDRLLADSLCPSCHEKIEAEMQDLWRRDPLAASIRQRVRPRHRDDDEGGARRVDEEGHRCDNATLC